MARSLRLRFVGLAARSWLVIQERSFRSEIHSEGDARREPMNSKNLSTCCTLTPVSSKDEDPTGLLNEGFRYRDLETGVWLSRDPAGFVDGPNLYAYVKQNPWTAFDPDGLKLKIPKSKSKEVDAYIRKKGVSGHRVQQGNQSTKGGEPIDTITGSASHDKSLTSEIIARMISSDRTFSFRDLKGLETHVGARKANVEYLTTLAKNVTWHEKGDRYPSGSWTEVPFGKRSYWEATNGDWRSALRDMRDTPGGALDCSRPVEYARMWGDLDSGAKFSAGGYPGATSVTLDGNDWIPGDQGKVWNQNRFPPKNWVVENTTYLGGGQWYANGMRDSTGAYNAITTLNAVNYHTQHGGVTPATGPATVAPRLDNQRNHVSAGLADEL